MPTSPTPHRQHPAVPIGERLTGAGPAAERRLTRAQRAAIRAVEGARPTALRAFDQIPMRGVDLLRQAELVGPALAGVAVAFVGDYDGTASMLGILAARGDPAPARMLVADFDERVLASARRLADRFGYGGLLETRRYNVFDPPPIDLVGRFDAFYCNPPYGSGNDGASARLFAARGAELVRDGGVGILILPDDPARPWTTRAARATRRFLAAHGWPTVARSGALHRYRLDDDPGLTSSVLVVAHRAAASAPDPPPPMPYGGRAVAAAEIPRFYGRSVAPPYPRYVLADGRLDFAAADMEAADDAA